MHQATSVEPATFGELLRFLRRRMQLTQQQLGTALGYSAALIARLESDDRLPDLALVKTAYVEALGLQREPELAAQLVALAERARGNGHAAPPSPAQFGDALRARSNLPRQLTPFIGRASELADVARLMADHSLITLTGPGGVGKTRLALELARSLLPDFPDSVRLVELAPLADPSLVPLAVARAFRLPEDSDRESTEALAAFLARRHALLVLDNCEHLVDACATLVDALLRACPELKILATSREPLRVPGEVAWRMPSVQPADAARLFESHARSTLPGFALSGLNAATVNDICRSLDGIPLAIELAAAQVRVLSVDQIATRLGDRLRLLTGGARTALPRQQTLRATLDWSYALLSEQERALFAQLAVFAGGWTLEAAEAVCEPDLLPLLRGLVDKSLVVAESREGAMRYRLLETLRQYAQERLSEARQVEALRDRHLAWCVAFMERAVAECVMSKLQPWKEHVQAEIYNLRAAQEWCRANAADASHAEAWLRLLVALDAMWLASGYGIDARQWLQRLWDSPAWERATRQPTVLPTTLQAKALYHLWTVPILFNVGHPRGALAEAAEACLAHCRAAGDQEGTGYALLTLATLSEHEQDYARAQALALESLRLFEELRDLPGLIRVFYHVGSYRALKMDAELVAILEQHLQWSQEWDTGWYPGHLFMFLAEQLNWMGEHNRAAVVAEQLVAFNEGWDDPDGISIALRFLDVADPPRALMLAEQQLTLLRQVGDEDGIAILLHRLGITLTDNGQYERALTVLDECVARFRAMGDISTLYGLERVLLARSVAARFLGDYHQALADLDECDRAREEGSPSGPWLSVMVPYHRGLTLLEMGDEAAAVSAFKASLREFLRVWSFRDTVPLALAALADVMWQRGQSVTAMRLAGIAAAHEYEERRINNPGELVHYKRTIAEARARLDAPVLASAWAEGQAMGWDQAISYGLAV